MLNFIGIGAQKAGTSWLYHWLSRHPNISFPAGKEVHFWNYHFNNGIDWYQSLFCDDSIFEGEITPAYALLPGEKIELLHQRFPSLRILFIIRNPLERAWSAALMALHRSDLQYSEASEQWFLDHFYSAGSRARGSYSETIVRWRSYFGGQMLIMNYDQLSAEPGQFLRRACQHLGIDGEFYAPFQSELKDKIFASDRNDVPRVYQRHLVNLYRSEIVKLNELLVTDLSHWLD